MVGWGHLVCPFMRPRSGGASRLRRGPAAAMNSGESCRPGHRWTGPLQRTARRVRRVDLGPESRGKEYKSRRCQSSVIINDWLTVRTAGKVKTCSLKTEGCGTRRLTRSYRTPSPSMSWKQKDNQHSTRKTFIASRSLESACSTPQDCDLLVGS